MRRYIKKRLLSLLESLDKAHNMMKTLFDKKDYEAMTQLLIDCQACAISIGTTIEEYEGESKETVGMLEEYCEKVYQLNQTINKKRDIAKQIRGLEKLIFLVINNVKYHIKDDKLEIVFLPYKASMWDSLESVWLSASRDEECNVYVIPIPYFDKTPEGTVGEIQYEGDMFPYYVPITNWREYKLEERHPDVVYFHNPYDQHNHVTSVHPDYYSKILRANSEYLVYIPYYCCGESQADVFYEMPSYYRADKIIIQSPLLKEYFAPNVHSKIEVLGSPKFDKVINYKSDNSTIPKEWQDIAGNRRIIMLNTSISSILKYKIQVINKIKNVFSRIKDRDDVVLLWRVHPLIKSTLKSMHPKLYEMYKEVESEFIDNKVGIYDNTSDITASVMFCEGYIGEESSSVMHLFGALGKPIFVLNMNLNNNDKLPLHFYDITEVGEELWFPSGRNSALYSMKKDSGLITMQSFGSNYEVKNRLYNKILNKGNRLYLIPYNHNAFNEYNADNGEWRSISIKNSVKGNFSSGCIYRDSLYMIPANNDCIVEYDMENHQCLYYEMRLRLMENVDSMPSSADNSEPLFFNGVCQRGHLILMASARMNKVIQFNTETKEVSSYTVGKSGNNYWGMVYDGEYYWLVSNRGRAIVKWDYQTGDYWEYNKFPEGYIGEDRCFYNIIFCNEQLLVFPKYSNMILKIDKNTGNIDPLNIELPYKEGERKENYNWPSNYYLAKNLTKDKAIAMTAYDNSLIYIDMKDEKYISRKCLVDENNWKSNICREFGRHGKNIPFACMENEGLTLNDFIKYVIDPDENVHNNQIRAYQEVITNMDGSCGNKIHQMVWKEYRSL